MTITLMEFMAIAIPTIGALAWLFRIESRVNVGGARYEDIISRLERIEAKVDRMNGRHE